MKNIQSHLQNNELLNLLNIHYKLDFQEIYLYREMIGYVYFVKNKKNKYVFKLFRHFHTQQALQSIEIINYLTQNDYPVVSIVPTCTDDFSIQIDLLNGQCIGILYHFIEGIEPDIKKDIKSIGQQIGELHKLMKSYPNELIRRSKNFFIDRFITMLYEIKYDSSKIKELEDYGKTIWVNMNRLPHGFCHGDLHSGNILQTTNNNYVLFDFDVASNAHSIIDVATLSDGTHFNYLEPSAYDDTIKKFEQFYHGYSKVEHLSNHEIESIFDFIAARHYEIIATITECEGINSLNTSFIDQQFDWLMKWRTLCEKKEVSSN